MDWLTALLLILGLVFIQVALGVWMAVALAISATAALLLLTDFPVVNGFASVAFSTLDSFVFTALPMFIFMGEIMLRSGASEQLYRGLSPLVARVPGRLLHANVLACTIFAAVSGSSAATAATIGGIALPALEKRSYDRGMVIGSLCGAGTLGLLIPPSLAMIVYGAIVGESIGRLFIAGILPGLLLSGLFMGYIALRALANPELAPGLAGDGTYSWADRARGVVAVLPMVSVIVLVLGLIYLGFTTPTEAAAIGVAAAIVMSVARGTFSLPAYWQATMGTIRLTAILAFIVVGAASLSTVVATFRIPQELMGHIAGADLAPLSVMVLICLIYLLLGCVFDGLAMQILTLPVVYPLVTALGYDGIWFGVILVILIEAAQLTPPVGLNLYVLRNISGWPIERIAAASLPYFLILNLAVVLLFVFPAIATWLPGRMG